MSEYEVVARWEHWRRLLRRVGLPVPSFMLPSEGTK